MRYAIDLEANNLLAPALDYTALPYKLKPDFKVWCVVVRNIDTDRVVSLYGNKLTYNHLKEALNDCTELIQQNGIAYDLPILQLYGLLDYSVGYPGQSSTVFSRDCLLTDTMLWSKLLNPDRLNGHSLEAWGKRLNNYKGDYSDWSCFSQEMLAYCIQDVNLTKDIYFELLKEKGTWDFNRAYAVEAKLQDLTLKQEVFGFAFNEELAKKNIQELGDMMQEIASKVDPILPPKKLTQSTLNLYTPPAKQFKKDGTLTVHMEKFIQKHNLQYIDWLNEVTYEGKTYSLPLTEPLKTVEVATTDDLDVVKGYLLSLGWKPSEVKERDLTKKADKTARTHQEIIETIDRYVKQTLDSVYKDLRLELLEVEADFLKDHLLARIDGTKPIYVPTSPKLTIGLEKEICPDLIRLGKEAEFAGSVVKYFTYRHRKNSIAGGVLDEDDEPTTGFLSCIREDGRIPTPADILGANTGRYRHKVVCNIPRVTSLYGYEMRALFGPGHGLYQLGFDFASLEARIMGSYVIGSPNKPYTNGIELAAALVAKKPLDIHTINAGKLGIPRDSAKSFSYACLPMNTEVLTEDGWKYYQDINEGDIVLTYNPEWDKVEKDVVNKKHFFKEKEIFDYSTSHSGFQCTEDHRWFGWRRTHTKGKPRQKLFGFFTPKDFTTEHNILLTAPYIGGNSSVTEDEAFLMGMILSDGGIAWSKLSEKTSASNGKRKEARVSISQSLNKFHQDITDCLDRLGLQYGTYLKKVANGNHIKFYWLKKSDGRTFLDKVVGIRKDKKDVNWSKWVITLSRPALIRFYEGFYLGDGCVTTKRETITQNKGNLLDCISIAAQLTGRGAITTFDKKPNCASVNVKKYKHIGCNKLKRKSLGVQDSFCLSTNNGTFIIRQGEFQGITGNCIYGAQPKKLAKMLGCSEAKAKQLFNAYWEAVPALKELKDSVEKYWESTGKKYILGLDGRRLVTRSKHSLINVLFQSGGAIVAKWSIVRIAQLLDEQGLLGNPFVDNITDLKVWAMIAMHDEMQYACHPKLLDVRVFPDDEAAKEAIMDGCSTIGHGKKGSYLAFKTSPIECIDLGIKQACQELGTRTEMGFEYSIGPNWAECH